MRGRDIYMERGGGGGGTNHRGRTTAAFGNDAASTANNRHGFAIFEKIVSIACGARNGDAAPRRDVTSRVRTRRRSVADSPVRGRECDVTCRCISGTDHSKVAEATWKAEAESSASSNDVHTSPGQGIFVHDRDVTQDGGDCCERGGRVYVGAFNVAEEESYTTWRDVTWKRGVSSETDKRFGTDFCDSDVTSPPVGRRLTLRRQEPKATKQRAEQVGLVCQRRVSTR